MTYHRPHKEDDVLRVKLKCYDLLLLLFLTISHLALILKCHSTLAAKDLNIKLHTLLQLLLTRVTKQTQ